MCLDDQILNTYLDNELTEPWKSQVEEHLSYCPSCRTRYQNLLKVSSAIRSSELTEEEIRPHQDRVLSMIEKNYLSKGKGKKSFLRRTFKFSAPQLIGVAAAFVVVFVGSWAVFGNNGSSDGTILLPDVNTTIDLEDAMGFNIYRYQLDADNNEINNTRINQEIVDIETTEYTDYDVTPGDTYYYMYKVLSTDLKEYDVSNVVAVTPLTATMGDANGSGDVDVADVITTVNYAAGMKPKPFIFEAADMNTDLQIDILDVVGIIQKILNPSAQSMSLMSEAIATYTVEDGVLYVESPVALAGVQVQLNMNEKRDVTTTETLDGFEQVSAWLSDNDMLFLAYNMNGKTLSAGKHALLNIGNADLSMLRLSDSQGRNVKVGAGSITGIKAMGSKVLQQGGIFNMNGQKMSGNAVDIKKLPKGVYIINGEKVLK